MRNSNLTVIMGMYIQGVEEVMARSERSLLVPYRLALVWVLLPLLVLMASAEGVQAQECRGNVRGRVVGPEGESVEAASVMLVSIGIGESTLTDEQGSFQLSGDCGENDLVISCLGYVQKTVQAVLQESHPLDLGEIELEINPQELQTVYVMGNPVAVKRLPDGFSVNVTQLAETSNNVLDLLGRLPYITKIGSDVKVAGKKNIVVRINNIDQRVSADRLSDFLQSMPADLLKSVDIITNPELRYNPDGQTAMIILHTTSKFNKYVGGMVAGEAMKGIDYNGHYSLFGTGMFNNDKLYIDIIPGYGHNDVQVKSDATYVYDNGNVYNNYTPARSHQNNVDGELNLQYQYDRRGHVGTHFTINTTGSSGSYTKEETRNGLTILNPAHDSYSKPHLNVGLYTERRFSDSFTAWLDGSFFNYRERATSNFETLAPEEPYPIYCYRSGNRLRVTGFNVANDYSLKFGEEGKHRLEFGYKVNYAHVANSRFDEERIPELVPIPQDDEIKVEETQVRPYVTYTVRPTNALFFRAGAQMAYTHRNISGRNFSDYKIDYTSFLPELIAFWAPSGVSQFQLSVTSGSSEPKYDEINPFEWRLNQYTYQKGNLDLKSRRYYSYSLQYTYRGNVSVMAFIDQWRNQVVGVPELADNLVINKMYNGQNRTVFGFRPTYYNNSLCWLTWSLSGMYGYSVSKALVPGIPAKVNAGQWGLDGYLGFTLNRQRTFTAHLNANYMSRVKEADAVMKPNLALSGGFAVYLLERRLSLELYGMYSNRSRGYTILDGCVMHFDNRNVAPRLYFSIRYRLNNVKDSEARMGTSMQDVDRRI